MFQKLSIKVFYGPYVQNQQMEKKIYSKAWFIKNSLECRNNWLLRKYIHIPGNFVQNNYNNHVTVTSPRGKRSSVIQTKKARVLEVRLTSN